MHILLRILPLVLCASAVHAEEDDYLRLSGPTVTGEVTRKGYERWIDIKNPGWSVASPATTHVNDETSPGKALPSALTWSQGLEPSVNDLLKQITQSKAFDKAEIHTLAAGPQDSKPTRMWTATGLLMTEVSLNGFDEVSASGVFRTLKLEVDSIPDDKQAGTFLEYNVATNKASGTGNRGPTIKLGSKNPMSFEGDDVRAFLRLDPKIAGNVDVSGYENWTEIDALSFNVTAENSFTKAGGLSVAKAQPGSLIWSQTLDETIPLTLHRILSAQSLAESVIELVKEGPLGPVTFAQLAFKGAAFTEIAIDDDKVTQKVVFREFAQTLFSFDDRDGRRSRGTTFTWDVTKQTSSLLPVPMLAPNVPGFGSGNLNPGALTTAGSEAQAPPEAAVVPLPAAAWLLLSGLGATAALCRGRNGRRKAAR